MNSWQIICNFFTVYLLKLYYLAMIAYLRNKMHKYSNQCSCASNKRNVLLHSDHTSYICILNLTIFFCEHFLHCWYTPTNMTIMYCYNSIYYIISKIFYFFLNVVIKCNCYLYIIICWCMEYKIVCKYVERTFVSWNNLFPIQMLYS